MKSVDPSKRDSSCERATRNCIAEPDGTLCTIKAYRSSCARKILIYLAYVVTCGLLRLVFHWFPHWMLHCTHRVCPLSEAQKVLIRDSSERYFIQDVMVSVIEEGSESEGRFSVGLFPAKALENHTVTRRRGLYGPNEILINVTPIIKMLLSECLNPFYCFQAFSCMLWFFSEYEMYASCILVMSSISLVVQVYEMRRNEVTLKKTISGSAFVTVCREVDGISEFIQLNSAELVPGDLIEIPRQGCLMHCDAFILSGNCIVNESTLTGESVPVTKTPLPEAQQRAQQYDFRSQARYILFGGTSVIQTRNFANERVLAVVARTGFRTTKGELVLSILFPRPMKFKFTQDALKFVGVLASVATIGLALSIYLMYKSGVPTGDLIVRCLDIITIVVPPALPVAMTIGIVFAQRRLRKHGIYCINPSVINVCGVINVTCFDKTGTLTEDGMDLWGVVPNGIGRFEEPHFEPDTFDQGPLLEAMASCHSLTRIDGVLCGDPLDLKMFQSTKWEFQEEVSEDHCKFQMVVPAIVRPSVRGSMTNITVESHVDTDVIPYEVGILRQFPFTSSLQRMSVIARVLNKSEFSVYTKGAPEMIETLCRRDTIPYDYQSVLLEHTREGYRVLALAWKPLKVSYPRMLRLTRERVENDLIFLGFLIMENRLKPESGPVIQNLRSANIRSIMVTGDNMLTALSVARDCEMIDEFDRVIIVSAKPPPGAVRQTSKKAGTNGTLLNGRQTNRPPSYTSIAATPPTFDQNVFEQSEPLVEFHYAEDLHKPVTEVTATGGDLPDWRGPRSHRAKEENAKKIRSAPRFRRWFRSNKTPRVNVPAYGAIPREPSHCEDGLSVKTMATIVTTVDSLVNPNGITTAPSGSRRVNIRMVDGPDFHLAIPGKSWAVIQEYYPWLIPKLVVKGTIFSRFSPDQKTQLIEALQSVGYFVAMCGDGANDCGALKAAHAGIALSEAEASVASPFTSKQHNISCVPTLIREGRCALVTSFGTFKFICGYSMIQFFTTLILYTFGSNMSDGQFLYIDLFLITSISITYGYTKAYPHLSVEPPSMRLLSGVTLASLGFHLLVGFSLQAFAFIWVRLQPWYIPLASISEDYELANYESSAVFTIAVYQYTISAIVFSKGAPYRRPILTNYLFIINLIVCIVATIYSTTYPGDWMNSFLELVRFPSLRFVAILHGVVVANFLACYILETIVDGVSFRHRLLRIRHALFPRQVQRKDYERIREEIDRLAGAWPPIIRSASVQALPRDLFHDIPDPNIALDMKRRERTISGLSTETEEDEWLAAGNQQSRGKNEDTSKPRYSGITTSGMNDTMTAKLGQRVRSLSGPQHRRRHSTSDLPDTWHNCLPNTHRDVSIATPPIQALDARRRFTSGGII